MRNDMAEVLFEEEQIQARVRELGAEITRDYEGKDLLVVGILKGAIVFLADLLRSIDLKVKLDFMAVSSYGDAMESSGVVRILKDLEQSLEGKNVLIVEDIVDSGLTLNYLVQNLKSRRPASLKVCTFLDKPERRQVEVQVDYKGFSIPDKFVVGYGLDYAERYRNLPYIGILKPELVK
ncbi:MAG: hypoxanthine phosphoribosyltransferase [Firmicutes bacterium]|nr:hypoxanthine phosphoribosyltransferase [Bacillota bacterium]